METPIPVRSSSVYAHKQGSIHMCFCMHTCTYLYTYIYTHMDKYAYMYVYISIMYVCIYICICIYVYMYTYIHIHTYLYVYAINICITGLVTVTKSTMFLQGQIKKTRFREPSQDLALCRQVVATLHASDVLGL